MFSIFDFSPFPKFAVDCVSLNGWNDVRIAARSVTHLDSTCPLNQHQRERAQGLADFSSWRCPVVSLGHCCERFCRLSTAHVCCHGCRESSAFWRHDTRSGLANCCRIQLSFEIARAAQSLARDLRSIDVEIRKFEWTLVSS